LFHTSGTLSLAPKGVTNTTDVQEHSALENVYIQEEESKWEKRETIISYSFVLFAMYYALR
jgi:hypothetical protein